MNSQRKQRQQKRTVRILWGMCLLPVLTLFAEFQWHFAERIVGLYLEMGNERRAKLERFVQQEIQTAQAREKVKQLVEARAERPVVSERRRKAPQPDVASEMIRLDEGKKLVMTRDRFLELYNRIERLQQAFPSIAQASDLPGLEGWSRTIIIRPGWFRSGEVFLVDDQNYVLQKLSLSGDEFALFDAYGTYTGASFDERAERVYPPRRFFEAWNRLPSELRDQVAASSRLEDLEDKASRIGLSGLKGGAVQVLIEYVKDGRIDVASIDVSVDLLHEIDRALGEAGPATEQ
jgi:hypothetical protein